MSADRVKLLDDLVAALVQSNEGLELAPHAFDHRGRRVLLIQGPNQIYEVKVEPWDGQQRDSPPPAEKPIRPDKISRGV